MSKIFDNVTDNDDLNGFKNVLTEKKKCSIN